MVTTLLPRITTMPSSFFSDADTCSSVSSSTRFMNWSKPRSVPVMCRLPLSLIANFLSM